MEPPARVRLHITPFNPSLLDRYVPDSLKPQASNISFHTVETFPERGFGYVELPTTEAQKLKAKLNGMTLKGAKVKIEEARPEKKRKSSETIDGEDVEKEKPRKKSKKDKTEKKEKKKEKPKRTEKVLPGYELEEGRHVKRGWAEETGKSKTGKKEKEGKKLKFKTTVDENKVVVEESKDKKVKKDKKEKKEKSKHGHKKEVVVTEFAKSTKLNFPNVKGERKDLTYEEGQGWVDKEGNVVEAEPPSKKRKRTKAAKEPMKAPVEEPDAEVENEEPRELSPTGDIASSDFSPSEASTVISSDESSDVDEETTRHLDQATSNALANTGSAEMPATALGSVSEMIQTPSPAEDQPRKEIHPLEALFKRAPPTATSSKEPTAQTESFGFFGNAADESSEDEMEKMQIDIPAANTLSALQTAPQTPHTKRDLEWRSIRSAAPTPDTAAIGKRFEFPTTINGYDDEEEDQEAEADDGEGNATVGVEDKKNAGREGESEFRQWFYQNRGDLNRAWKKRRKEERKVERQRENRRAGRKMA